MGVRKVDNKRNFIIVYRMVTGVSGNGEMMNGSQKQRVKEIDIALKTNTFSSVRNK